MEPTQLYRVVFETEIVMLAKSEVEAVSNARFCVKEEIPKYIYSEPVKSENQLGEWLHALPYGARPEYVEKERNCWQILNEIN